jgi:hypothetical protein
VQCTPPSRLSVRNVRCFAGARPSRTRKKINWKILRGGREEGSEAVSPPHQGPTLHLLQTSRLCGKRVSCYRKAGTTWTLFRKYLNCIWVNAGCCFGLIRLRGRPYGLLGLLGSCSDLLDQAWAFTTWRAASLSSSDSFECTKSLRQHVAGRLHGHISRVDPPDPGEQRTPRSAASTTAAAAIQTCVHN